MAIKKQRPMHQEGLPGGKPGTKGVTGKGTGAPHIADHTSDEHQRAGDKIALKHRDHARGNHEEGNFYNKD